MSDITLDAQLELSPSAAHKALRDALVAMCERSKAGEVSLAAALPAGDRGDIARVTVPVRIESNAEGAHEDEQLSLTVAARSAQAAFPTFEGRFNLEELDAARTRVLLVGTYRVPLGPLGAAANALGLDPIARESLRGLLDDVVSLAHAQVRSSSEQAYRDSRRGG